MYNNTGRITFRESPAGKINHTLRGVEDELEKIKETIEKTNEILERTNEIWEEFLRVSKLKPLGLG